MTEGGAGGEGEGGGARETTFRARFDLEAIPTSGSSSGPGGVHFQVADAADAAAGAARTAAFVMAVTSVDQAWGARLVKGWPDTGPQVQKIEAISS